MKKICPVCKEPYEERQIRYNMTGTFWAYRHWNNSGSKWHHDIDGMIAEQKRLLEKENRSGSERGSAGD